MLAPLLFLLVGQSPAAQIAASLDVQTYPAQLPNEAYAVYDAREKEYWQARDALILKLFSLEPENERIPKLLPSCWAALGRKAAEADIHRLLANDAPPAVEGVARATRARFQLADLPKQHSDVDVMAIWADLSSHCLYSPQAPEILYSCAKRLSSKINRTRQYRILAQLYPGYERLPEIAGELKDWSGRPNFELDFKEICTNKPDSMCAKRGRVVLVYFTKDGAPPQPIHDLYLRYHDSGLETIGVVATSKPTPMPWPLVGDANHGVRRSWGIDQDPTVFLVDKEGCLAYANPADIEVHVKELLAQR